MSLSTLPLSAHAGVSIWGLEGQKFDFFDFLVGGGDNDIKTKKNCF